MRVGLLKILGPYAAAVGLVCAAFIVRWAIHPSFGYTHAYSAFVPMILITAYLFGARPALLAAILSFGLGFTFFASPAPWFGPNVRTLASLGMFVMTVGVAIYFITGMGRALRDLAAERARAQALADSHAELFRELNERVTNHLQLVAAVLQLQARTEQNRAVSSALAEASCRTLEISKVHRSLTSDQNEALDFQTFAAQLLKNTLEARGQSTSGIVLDAAGVRLTPDQATSVGLVLLECLNSRLRGAGDGSIRIHMRGDDKEVRLEVCRSLDSAEPYIRPASPYLVTAMVEQLSGRFTERSDAEGATLELVFPRTPTPQPTPASPYLNSAPTTLH
jgi:two-component sensor histidine kinase